MNDPILNNSPLSQPKNRRLLIMLGVALLALVVVFALWQNSGTRGAKRDLSAANGKVADKQKEVDDAKRLYDQKVAELRAVRADADVQATKLGGAIDQRVDGVVNDARVDVPATAVTTVDDVNGRGAPGAEYYVRDRHGRFVRVTGR